jgi:signal peptidase II
VSSAPKNSSRDNGAAGGNTLGAAGGNTLGAAGGNTLGGPPPTNSVGNALRGVPSALPVSRYVVFFTLAALGCTVDLWTKHAIFQWRGLPQHGNIYWLIENRFGIETSVNPGALFGMGAGFWPLFAALSVVALAGIITWLFAFRAAFDRWITVALGLVSGGIIGNLYDRLGLWDTSGLIPELQHGVRDWILFVWPEIKLQIFNPWPNFNIADSLLVTGAIMLVVHAIIWRETEHSSVEKVA